MIFIIYLTHANVWESMGKLQVHAILKKPYFILQVMYVRIRISTANCEKQYMYQYYESHENLYQVLQVYAAPEHAMKSKVSMIKS